MKNIKIIISPSKTFNIADKSNNPRPKYLAKAKNIFLNYIKPLSLKETKSIYGISDKLALTVFNMHQAHGEVIYNAIELFGGTVFKQLELNKFNKKWVQEHVMIIDPLYGPLKPYDSIAPYRLDMKVDVGINLKEYWKEEVEKELEWYEVINLASKEYTEWFDIDMKVPELDPKIKQIKKARGIKLNELIIKYQNLFNTFN